MRVPCQITQWYLLPALSAELVREMKKLGVKQADIARQMGVTPAAVSQYVKGKRGRSITFTPEIGRRIAKFAKRMAASEIGEEELSREMCELCILARRSRVVCGIHKGITGHDRSCSLCRSGVDAK
jgi:predicted transcriptional regulator